MSTTLQDVLNRARIPLNDDDKVAYPDAELLPFAVAGIQRAIALRPDFRFGQYGTPLGALTLASAFPLPEEHLQTVADYVTFRAETKDDEHINSNRALAFNSLFEKELTT